VGLITYELNVHPKRSLTSNGQQSQIRRMRDVESKLLIILLLYELGFAAHFIAKADLGRRSMEVSPENVTEGSTAIHITRPMHLEVKAVVAIGLVRGQNRC